jgi:hypothetical protein
MILFYPCTIYLIYIYTVYPINSPLFNVLIFDSILSIMDHQYSIIPLLISFIQISHEYSIIRFLDKLYIHINSAMSIYPVNGPLIYHPHLTPIVYIIFYYPFTFDFVYPYPIDIQLYIQYTTDILSIFYNIAWLYYIILYYIPLIYAYPIVHQIFSYYYI